MPVRRFLKPIWSPLLGLVGFAFGGLVQSWSLRWTFEHGLRIDSGKAQWMTAWAVATLCLDAVLFATWIVLVFKRMPVGSVFLAWLGPVGVWVAGAVLGLMISMFLI